MKDIMRDFCMVSGHQVNLTKSKAFFSKSVNFNRAVDLRNEIGIGLTGDLGKYLGVPLVHGRITKLTYFPILHKARKRLAGWKSRYLTMAGRTTLIKAVLSALPAYQMQTTMLPKGVLKELDKICRTFFWNQMQEGKKMHLIAWDQIKQDKDTGGLGIKDLHNQNMAYIMKLCWGLLTKPEALWVKCLKGKYGCGNDPYPMVYHKFHTSQTWKSITMVWNSFWKGVGRKLNDGRTSNAWWDLWTSFDMPLIHLVDRNLHALNPCATVRDFVLADGSWDLQKWSEFLPQWVINIISLKSPPCSNGKDTFYWRNASDGNFSVKTAYELVSRLKDQKVDIPWKKVWNLPVPEKVKLFLWQAIHERLPTNYLRAQRGLSHCEECPFQCQRVENTIHILRDCEIARTVWAYFVNPNSRFLFFRSDLQGWLKMNLSQNMGSNRSHRWPWRMIFSIICWLLWKNRCKGAIEGVRKSAKDLIHQGLFHLMESSVWGKFKNHLLNIDEGAEPRWMPPPAGYIRLDTDGSASTLGSTACGGLLRDNAGNWVVGFQRRLNTISSTGAEIMGILTGLQICKQFNFMNVHAYTDSLEAYNLVMREGGQYHPLTEEIKEIRRLLCSDWDIQLYYVSREAIRCADFLARDAQQLLGGLVVLPMMHPGCRQYMIADRICNQEM